MNLKELRKNHGYKKQKDFSKALDVKATTISMWETGAAIPRLPTMLKIAEVLGVEIKNVTDCFKRQN